MGDVVSVAGNPRVLFIMNSLAMGGTERKVVNIANRLAAGGWAVHCVYLREPHDLLPVFEGAVQVEYCRRASRVPVGVLRRIAELHRSNAFTSIVAVNLYPTMLLAALAATRRLAGARCVSLMNTSSQPRLRDKLAWPLHIWSLGRMHTVVYGSEIQRRFWVSQGRAQWARSQVIYNGVDVQRFAPPAPGVVARERQRWGIPPDRFVVGSVGRLVPEKNHATLIQAVSHLRACNPHVLLAGHGPLRQELEQLADRLGIRDRVTFTGPLGDVRPALHAMDVFVLPSIAVETFSNAALEAMASALPVVLSDVGGAAEMVRHGVDGYVLECSGLLDRLTSTLDGLWRDIALRQRLGSEARSRTVTQFSSDSMFPLYRSLLG